MQTSRKFTQGFLALTALLLLTSVGLAADPGAVYPPESEVSDQKAGSILIFNIYTSSTSNPGAQNTRFNITNTSSSSSAFVHLFFIEGSTCNVADRFTCFTPNQTSTFLASQEDPGTTGYFVAIAVNLRGCPVSFNFLIGDEYVKFETGHFANLGAEAFAALYFGELPSCDGNSVTAVIAFNGVAGVGYNRVPRVLAIDNIGSRADGNIVRVWINRISGDLSTAASGLGSFFGILFDDAEGPHSFTLPGGVCQRAGTLGNDFPRTVPRFELVIPAGSTGWLKLWQTSDNGILGASINFNANAAQAAGAFNSGHNMHKLTLSANSAYVMPVFPPSC